MLPVRVICAELGYFMLQRGKLVAGLGVVDRCATRSDA
jgi:hypothetical protein